MAEPHRHAWANRLQTLLLVLTLLGISALGGALLLGEDGMWIALGASLLTLVLEPAATGQLTLRLYGASPMARSTAPGLWLLMERISKRAALPSVPRLYYVPSPIINAFAVGRRRNSAIAVTDGLLRSLADREIAGVLAHETAHIAHDDLRVMGLADYVSRLTGLFALLGQLMLLLSLPSLVSGTIDINWVLLALLVLSPHLALLAQLGLSRVREFDADRAAASFTGDPEGLASALAHIERVSRSWRMILMPGWGNPEPSWLRTHPATEDRITRLLELSRTEFSRDETEMSSHHARRHADAFPAPRHNRPRWRPGGFWW
ncbi:zinc metalloprotease HtpX [Azoarcus sp. KH32C]|uniref:zinc metalloprotease HtpX n=1 Tax=Azoarcus sp. KH32C TaxID=748247 RepID=UPI0002386768|nr:zinc metalloprotease HtpX [Azoarcus sp. KH32C]BAL25300.1 peptidase [Azoarcus sp. KH32C]